jgi:hypothetical protein
MHTLRSLKIKSKKITIMLIYFSLFFYNLTFTGLNSSAYRSSMIVFFEKKEIKEYLFLNNIPSHNTKNILVLVNLLLHKQVLQFFSQ